MRAGARHTGGYHGSIGILVPGAGLYYLAKEKHDSESEKIYTIVSIIGGIVAAVCAMPLLI